ncbi:hypothetical protein ElyMa_002085300, partial [Elysia marginata]
VKAASCPKDGTDPKINGDGDPKIAGLSPLWVSVIVQEPPHLLQRFVCVEI